ncbi:MAG: hypothetical protein IKS63_00990 [Firmicutes bacterium]|nr:hypothetical protein [Bacillota bacterium]
MGKPYVEPDDFFPEDILKKFGLGRYNRDVYDENGELIEEVEEKLIKEEDNDELKKQPENSQKEEDRSEK